MKKTLTLILTALSFMLILDSMNAGHAIIMFFLAGVIPGTNIAIEASRMLEIFALLLGFTLSRIVMGIAQPALSRRHLGVFKRYNTLSPEL